MEPLSAQEILRRARFVTWITVGVFAVIAAFRFLLGHQPLPRTTYDEFWWDLRVFWIHRGFLEWSFFAVLLAGAGLLCSFFIKLISRGRVGPSTPSQEPRPEKEPSPKKAAGRLSEGAVGIFLLGLMCALGGTVLCFLPHSARIPWPPVLFTAGAFLLVISTIALLVRWKRTFGQVLVLPGIALVALGTIIWLTREDEGAPNPWEDTPDLSAVCRSAIDNYRLGFGGHRLSVDDREASREAVVVIERDLLSMGQRGVRGILEFENSDCWWTVDLLLRFGKEAIPTLLEGLRHPVPVARRRSVSVLSNWAHDPTVAEAVVPSLYDPDYRVRHMAVTFFSDGSGERGARPPAVRSDHAAASLRELMWDRDPGIRKAALETLRYQKREAVWPNIRAFLQIEFLAGFIPRRLRRTGQKVYIKYPAACGGDPLFRPGDS